MFCFRLVAIAVCLASALPLVRAEGTLLKLDQVRRTLQLAGIEGDEWTFLDPQGQLEKIPSSQIVRYGAPAPLVKTPLIVLASGGRIVLQDILLSRRQLVGYPTRTFDEVKLPLRMIRGIALRLPLDDVKRQELLDRIENYNGIDDQLLLENGDVISGLVAAIKSETIQLETESSSLEVDRTRVAAILFAPGLTPTSKDSFDAWIGLRDGSLLPVRKIKFADDEMTAEIGRDVTLVSVPGASLLRDIVYAEPHSSDVIYVSDLPKLQDKQVSFLTTGWSFQRDRNVLGAELSADGQLYRKGLGVHSTSRLAAPIPKGFKRFAAEIAVDGSSGSEGSVNFRVYLAGADGVWKPAYQGEIIRGGMPAEPISVPLGEAAAIALVVDFADRGDVKDRADWLSARFEK
ncbi:NPCBM/NEW2 domain-containing protein [Blastopirellula sp. JC732]|uniref:NPCBM/NEW2 domain-containing protein n=1 Tax=Blastopirellula sediminis TaxID=2894196 RepID=A0A9X1MRF5_9BACT|nr:NPCBM/NEW2 domain-containing protein [Blastopirellula sediminis]MCC9605334.1 NPCBM/NEW2 domain-containing protein [Blastopirellula sediminis]MCC9631366.1 NPCBM/NEW2 domain-containing protein [Blastopirellula sediminis]